MTIRSPRWLAIAVLCVAGLLTFMLVDAVTNSKDPAALSSKSGPHTLRTADGTMLSAYSYVPSGSGPFPLVVLPASWGSPATEYASVANGFAALGYVAVAYAQRGFGASTGQVDLAGAGSQSDVSAVISWALAHTPSAKSEVGVVGTSYGAGVALLAAERDSRIKAVVALSGWTDLARTLAPGGTLSRQPYLSLFATVPAARMTPEVRTFVTQLRDRNVAGALSMLRRLSPSRSPITRIAALNKRRTAVMLGDAYEDSLLPAGSAVTFYNALTAPKRLEFAVGDHAGPALSGLLGHKNALWANAARWTDRYLVGGNNGIDTQSPIQLQDATTLQPHGYADWAAVGRATTLRLGATASGTGLLSTTAAPAWTDTLAGGVDTIADAGAEQFTSAKPYQEPTVAIAGVSRSAGAVWAGPVVRAATLVSGTARLHLNVSAAGSTSLFAYLYDVDGTGTGRLMTTGTVTVPGSGSADISLEPIAWTVAAGHHVNLVVDTVDPRYLGSSKPGRAVIVGSTPAGPATLLVPIG